MDRSHPLFSENLFRPTFEVSAGHWLASLSIANLVFNSFSSEPTQIAQAVSVVLAGMSFNMYNQSKHRVKLYEKIRYNDYMFAQLDKLILGQEKDLQHVYIGKGFHWGPEHTARVRELMRLSSDLQEIKLPFLWQLCTKNKKDTTKKLGGHPYIHAVGLDKAEQSMRLETENFKGHTLIYGQVGTGKTSMLQLLSSLSLVRDNTVIVIDPKNDLNWLKTLKYTAKMKNRPFYYFHPSQPSSNIVKIDAIGTYTKASEIASRLQSILPSGGDSESFSNYAWSQFNAVAEGLLFIGKKPNLITIHKYLFIEREELVELVLDKYLDTHMQHLSTEPDKHPKIDSLEKKITYYKKKIKPTAAKDDLDTRHRRTVMTMINYITLEDPARYAVMMSTTKPLIEQLVATPLDELLSPVFVPGAEDHRPIITTKGVMETGGVLYIALDSMSDPTISSVIAKMLLADVCANAAERYNSNTETPPRLSLFVDEAHSALNDPLLDLMAMGRAAEIEVYLSSQTQPDYEHKAGKEIAKRLTGLCGNVISMRVSDADTQEFVTSRLGETRVTEIQRSRTAQSNTQSHFRDYMSTYIEGFKHVDSEVFPITLLSDLPKLQYVGHFSDGSKRKGVIPIIKFNAKTSKEFAKRTY
ncbi:conjugative transfer system coupling protein TraD [Pseudoalteromonas sp. T1lg23B]|uniref:conjugative transfer system coupling protein TraD n=1 Tax=Pseudoalteromonas sp. T1lg23B TaxID=2077097 RepID=UPI000CF6831E|nr:conjugative transfer system coupling protein TraD [Pseudoalteromonas sp. T1lg23B]